MQNSKEKQERLHNRVAAGKQPVGMLPRPRKMVLKVLQVVLKVLQVL